MRFVDTNVLVYSLSKDPGERDKQRRAHTLLSGRDLCLSAQVLQEFYVEATRSTRADALSHQQAERFVNALSRFPVQPITLELVQAAMATRDRFELSYWDAAIIEAARAMACEEVLSEDLSHGQSYNGVAVVNPFL